MPAVSGTRIGPQRIFVEIAREAATLGYSSFRMDMDRAGDSLQTSFNIENSIENPLVEWYKDYLDVVTTHFNNEGHNYKKYLLLSISLGCEPILKYAIANLYDSVLFLSPTYLDYINKSNVNSKNLKAYKQKIFKKETWIKLLKFDLNWRKIVKNIISNKKKDSKSNNISGLVDKSEIKVFGVYGELDAEFKDSMNYWKGLKEKGIIASFVYEIVKNSDHNFFGYQFKEDVKSILKKWLSSF